MYFIDLRSFELIFQHCCQVVHHKAPKNMWFLVYLNILTKSMQSQIVCSTFAIFSQKDVTTFDLHVCVGATKETLRRDTKVIVNHDYIKQCIIFANNFFGWLLIQIVCSTFAIFSQKDVTTFDLHVCVGATKETLRRDTKVIVNHDYIKQCIIFANNFFGWLLILTNIVYFRFPFNWLLFAFIHLNTPISDVLRMLVASSVFFA